MNVDIRSDMHATTCVRMQPGVMVLCNELHQAELLG